MTVNLINEQDLNRYIADLVYQGNDLVSFGKGNFKSKAYVKQNKDDIVRAMIHQWAKTVLRQDLLKKEENSIFLKEIEEGEKDLPRWAVEALSEQRKVHRFVSEKVPDRFVADFRYV